MFKRFKQKRIQSKKIAEFLVIDQRLDELNKKYKKRLDGVHAAERYRDRKDFFSLEEKREWSHLAYAHYNLIQELGLINTPWWRPQDGTPSSNSPLAFLQVTRKTGIDAEWDIFHLNPDTGERDRVSPTWYKDEEFDRKFKDWMGSKGFKSWKNMTAAERRQEQKKVRDWLSD